MAAGAVPRTAMEAKIAKRDQEELSVVVPGRLNKACGPTMNDNDPVMKIKVDCHDSWRDWTMLLSTVHIAL